MNPTTSMRVGAALAALALVAATWAPAAGSQEPPTTDTHAEVVPRDDGTPESDTSGALDPAPRRALMSELRSDPQIGPRLGHFGVGDAGELLVPLVSPTPPDIGAVGDLAAKHGVAAHVLPAIMTAAESHQLKADVQSELDRAGLADVPRMVGVEAPGIVFVAIDPAGTLRAGTATARVDAMTIDRLNIAARASDARDFLDGRVVVESAMTRAIDGAIEEAVAGNLVRVDELGDFSLEEARDNTPVQGARWAYFDRPSAANGRCTWGYVVLNPNGIHRITTAGHCWTDVHAGTGSAGVGVTVDTLTASMATAAGADTGDDVSNNVTQNKYSDESTADVMVLKKNLVTSSPATRPRINDTGSSHLKVRGQVDNDDMAFSDDICFSGWGTHDHGQDQLCDDLLVLSVDVNTPGSFQLRDLACIRNPSMEGDGRTYGGDSGGPWYEEIPTGANAYGIHHGGFDSTISGTSYRSSCFSKIENVFDELGTGWTLKVAS